MANNVLFLTHGMGWNLETGPQAWSVEVEQALEKAWNMFPALNGFALADFVRLVPLSYDKVFRDYLSTIAGDATRVKTALGASDFAKVAGVIADADAEEANFFWTNVMDVLLYRFGGDLHRLVHDELALQLATEVRNVWANNGGAVQFSMLTHSLGTATMHGTLNRLAGGPIGSGDSLQVGGNFKLRSYVSLANVSRVLWPGPGSLYGTTLVRPSTQALGPGYVEKFVNVRHIADPFPAAMRFAPSDWGTGYREITIKHLRSANVHGYTHYLAHPRAAAAVLRPLLPSGLLTPNDVEAAAAAYRDVDLDDANKRQQVEQAIADVAKDLAASYDDTGNVLTGSIELIGRVVRDVWRHWQRLKAVMDAIG
jgi:hypothetical protein